MENANENNDTVEGGVRDDEVAAEMAAVNIDDESDDEGDSDDENYHGVYNELTEDVMVQLKNNDPTVKKVDIYFYPEDGEDYFDATTFDWEEDSSAISENTHLKAVYTNYWPHNGETDIANAKAFCRALSKNRSIKHYEMERCPLEVGETFTILAPFFKHNTNLRSFVLQNEKLQFQLNLQIVVSALAGCQSLRKISLHSCYFNDDSAEYVVSSLGAHQNLRELSLRFLGNNIGKKWIIALGGLLQNRFSKLRSLNLNINYVGDDEASVLGEALSKNRKLKKLCISSMNSITSFGWAALFRGIANSVSLEEINVSYNTFGNEEALSFAAEYAIARNTSLKSLAMRGEQSISSIGWGTLFRSLFNPSSILEMLVLNGSSIDDIGVTALGDALANGNTKLKVLNLGHIESITAAGWAAFFQSLVNYTALEDVNLLRNNIDDEALVALTTALFTSGKLKVLDLSNNPSISAEGWQTFFISLQNFNLSLKQFFLRGNSISDAVMPSLTNVLTSARSLSRLDLEGNRAITPVGWTALSNILQHPNSRLADLFISGQNQTAINDEVVIGFTNALINNKRLKTLDFGCINNPSVTARGWAALANGLCNKSSLESIYNSNHTLTNVGWGDIPSDLASYMCMNENDNKNEVARQKILKYHFIYGEGNVEEFEVEMELAIIPYAIAWMGRDISWI